VKLRTEMLELGGEWRVATFVGLEDKRDPATAKEHDAAAAHALLQAMSHAYNTDPNVIDFVEERAAELMKGWGFE